MEVRSLVAGDGAILGRNGEMFEQILQTRPGLRGVASEPFPESSPAKGEGLPSSFVALSITNNSV